MVTTAAPVAKRAGASEAAAALDSEGSTSPTPMPPMTMPGSNAVA